MKSTPSTPECTHYQVYIRLWETFFHIRGNPAFNIISVASRNTRDNKFTHHPIGIIKLFAKRKCGSVCVREKVKKRREEGKA